MIIFKLLTLAVKFALEKFYRDCVKAQRRGTGLEAEARGDAINWLRNNKFNLIIS
jgi:hypothetical protein